MSYCTVFLSLTCVILLTGCLSSGGTANARNEFPRGKKGECQIITSRVTIICLFFHSFARAVPWICQIRDSLAAAAAPTTTWTTTFQFHFIHGQDGFETSQILADPPLTMLELFHPNTFGVIFPGCSGAEVQRLEPNLAPQAVGSGMVVVGQRPEAVDQAGGCHGGPA